MIGFKKKAISLITAFAALLCMLPSFSAFAESSDGIMITITRERQLVDTMTLNGVTVNAIYHPIYGLSDYEVFSDETYSCAALVSKFYKAVYGVETSYLYPGSPPQANNATFVKTSSPKVGDIYGSYNHWAIVKAVSRTTVTLFEQNWCWIGDDGKTTFAQYARKVDTKTLRSDECFYTRKNVTDPSYAPVTPKISKITPSLIGAKITVSGSGADGYKICVSERSDFANEKVYVKQATATNEFNIDGLAPNKTYHLRVYGYYGAKSNNLSTASYSTFKTDPMPQLVVVGKHTALAAIRIVFKNAGVSGYRMRIADNKEFTNSRVVTGTSPELRFDFLSPGKTYYLRACSYVNSGGNTYYSPNIVFTVNTDSLGTPTVRETASVADALRLEFNNTGVQGYRVRIADNKNFNNSKVVMSSSSSVRFDNLKQNTTYYLRACTYTKVGSQVYYSPCKVFEVKTKSLSKPVENFTSTVADAVRIEFNKANVNGYKMEIADNKEFKNSKTTSSVNPSLRFDNLKSNTTYYIRAYTYTTARGKTAYSTPVVFAVKTKATDVKPVVAETNTVKYALRVNLNKENVNGYKLVIADNKDFKNAKAVTDVSPSLRFDNLKSGTTYYLKASTYTTAKGKQTFSKETSFTLKTKS